MTPSDRLAGKVVLLSGVGGGQGRIAARMFAGAGASVAGTDLDADAAAVTADLVREDGYEMQLLAPIDLAAPDQAEAWVQHAVDAFGGIDVLYNNAGVPRFVPFDEISEDDFRFTIRNELDVLWFPAKAAWPHLVRRGGGSVINIGSISGVRGVRSLPQTAHAASKGAVIAWTRALAAEGAASGIRVNCVSPGLIDSPPSREILALGDESPLAPMLRSTPLGIGKPQDVVYAALYLASDESRWVTGTNILVDGGLTSVLNA